MAASNISIEWWKNTTEAQAAEESAWIAKFEQAYRKAEFVFGNEPAFMRLEKLYKEKTSAIKMKKWKLPLTMAGSILGVILMMLFMILAIGK